MVDALRSEQRTRIGVEIEPGCPIALLEHDGCPVVVGVQRGTCGLCDDGEALYLAGIRRLAAVPEAREADRRVILGGKAPFGLLALLTRPFIPALGRHQAAALLEAVTEGAGRGDRLRARVERRELEFLQSAFVPPGHEPPPGADHLYAVVTAAEDRCWDRGSYLELRLEIGCRMGLGEAQREPDVGELLHIAAIGFRPLIVRTHAQELSTRV